MINGKKKKTISGFFVWIMRYEESGMILFKLEAKQGQNWLVFGWMASNECQGCQIDLKPEKTFQKKNMAILLLQIISM